MSRPFFLVHAEARRNAAAFCMEAPTGWMVLFSEPPKHRGHEKKYHAMIGEIAAMVEHIGRQWDADDMKRLLVDEFADEMRCAGTPLHHDGRVAPSLDGRRTVQLGMQTAEFTANEAQQFIEFLYAFGTIRGVEFKK